MLGYFVPQMFGKLSWLMLKNIIPDVLADSNTTISTFWEADFDQEKKNQGTNENLVI